MYRRGEERRGGRGNRDRRRGGEWVVGEDIVLIEPKSVERLLSIHCKQVLTYLRLSGLKIGLLVNFNSELIKDGIRRIVNDL